MSASTDRASAPSRSHSSLFGAIGPGIVFAAAAVGVSHLVQSTRAGASYGLGMLSIIIIACLIKYPAIRFGNEYAAATGNSLVQSYRQTGLWAILIYGLAHIFSMVFVIAAVSLVTVGLIKSVFGLGVADITLVAALLGATIIILLSGGYHLLEILTKIIVPVFTLLILIAVVMVMGRIDWTLSNLAWPELSAGTVMFIVALGGFMPAPVDASVLQSLWTQAKADCTGRLPSPAEARFDFNVGFVTSLILALCFMLLGAGVMHDAGIPLARGAGGFASQVIDLFTSVIGQWTFPIIGAAAITVMLSTVVTVLDGYSRIAEAIIKELSPGHAEKVPGIRIYDLMLAVISVGALIVLAVFMRSFAAFIDLTSVIVFLLGPVLAFLNHKAMFGEEVPLAAQPGACMRIWSMAGLVAMVVLALIYLWLRLN